MTKGELRQFGQRLEQLRRRAAVTKPELATRAGLSMFYVHRLEQGQQEPRIGPLLALSKALGCCACRLLP